MTTATCTHHWLVATPAGPTVDARCKRCGAERTFPTTPESLLDTGGVDRALLLHITPNRAKAPLCACGAKKSRNAEMCAACYQLEKKTISLPSTPSLITVRYS